MAARTAAFILPPSSLILHSPSVSSLRTYLVLGRTSNLPTVWSNILCALLLTSTSFSSVLIAHLFVGITLLYIGGMYMNDFCDAAWDQANGKNRPIPSGAITAKRVQIITALLMGGGLTSIALIGQEPTLYGMLLVALISAYNVIHKRWAGAFLLMAGCRSLIYLIVSVTAVGEITGAIMVAAVVQFAYVSGVTLLARKEESSRSFNPLGMCLIGFTFIGALYHAIPIFNWQIAAVSALFLGWTALSLQRARTPQGLIPGKAIGPLLAGIPLLDLLLLSVLAAPYLAGAATISAFFAAALLAQRFIPAS